MLVGETGVVDVATASAERFSSDIGQIFDRWDEFADWANQTSLEPTSSAAPTMIGPPSPRPRQTFGIGVNYRRHAEEAGWPLTEVPMVFTKYPSCIAGPGAVVELTGPRVDWEVELVVVIGRTAHHVSADSAWSHVAGLTIGQDISDRDRQARPDTFPQFSLGKSHAGFGPIGPVLVTVDEFADPDDLALGCELNGSEVQKGRTSDLIFNVPDLIEYLSGMLPLLPGDLIFTGTPSGVGAGMQPPTFLRPGDVIRSWIDGIGEMTQSFAAGTKPTP
ncbi:fumarylacetoacetate hydrolase family protein [Spirillospora sp. CA-255316]